ncbi:FecR domain-containing protein [Flavivirga aquimarina]|uniref:FecR domain-containing protein n=1 Tax=Flavivirga aquimarina TaxID=2027862 RepID=A0ABT8W537_9FLAO|nr:FecR family protein [Flavivirga aquimarina]MDO5968237.1 FecR domain-containing protein [Flavivirga aquimarina]
MEVTPQILKKYVKGNCSEIESKAVEVWLKSTNSVKKTEKNLDVPTFLEEKLWQNIQAATGDSLDSTRSLKSTWNFLGIAATVLLFIGLGIYNVFFNNYEIYKTDVGQIQTIVLDDGTRVYLNSVSELKVPKEFTTSSREISLNGEAFFEVSKDSLRPFIINTRSSLTKVLGTEFNLSAYANENVALTLHGGRVLFAAKDGNLDDGIILRPGEQAILKDSTITKKSVIPQNYIGWISEKLIFNNEPFELITQKLERRYGVTIRIEKESLKKDFFKGRYDKPKLDTLLEDLSFVLKFNYRKEGEIIIIY